MPRGRPPKFPALKRLEGNRAKVAIDMIRDKGIKAGGEIAEADYAPEDAAFALNIIKNSMPPGVYATVDSFILNTFCIAFAANKLATEHLFPKEVMENPGVDDSEKRFITCNDKGTESVSSWWKIFSESAKLMAQYATMLGLEPRARLQMMMPETNSLDDEDKELLEN